MSSYLFSFPDELLVTITTSWLNLPDVVRLDTACCSHSDREPLLKVLSCSNSELQLPAYDPMNPFYQESYCSATSTAMSWVLSRCLPLTEAYVTEAFYNKDLHNIYLKRHGRHITRILFDPEEDMHRTLKWRSAFEDVCALCPNVKHITCALDFTVAEYRSIAKHWPYLSSVKLGKGCDDECLHALSLGCTRLAEIIEPACTDVSSEGWLAFFQAVGSTITKLESDGTLQDISPLLPFCPQLRRLRLYDEVVTDEVLRGLSVHCPLVESLDLLPSIQIVTLDGLLLVARHGKLQELQMDFTAEPEGWDGKFDELVKCNPLLRKISLAAPDLEPVLLSLGKYCRHLVEVDITPSKVDCISFGLSEDVALLPLVRANPNLQVLSIEGPVGDEVLMALGETCRDLHHLSFVHSALVSDTGVTALAKGCRYLRQLSALAAPVTMVGIHALAENCTHLRKLSVQANVDGIEALAGTMMTFKRMEVHWAKSEIPDIVDDL